MLIAEIKKIKKHQSLNLASQKFPYSSPSTITATITAMRAIDVHGGKNEQGLHKSPYSVASTTATITTMRTIDVHAGKTEEPNFKPGKMTLRSSKTAPLPSRSIILEELELSDDEIEDIRTKSFSEDLTKANILTTKRVSFGIFSSSGRHYGIGMGDQRMENQKLKDQETNSANENLAKKLLAEIKELQRSLNQAYEPIGKDALYYFWYVLSIRLEVICGHKKLFEVHENYNKYIIPIKNTLRKAISIWMNFLPMIHRKVGDKKFSFSEEFLLMTESTLTGHFLAASEFLTQNIEEKLNRSNIVQEGVLGNKSNYNDFLFWPRMFGLCHRVKFLQFANALYLHLNVVEKQHLHNDRNIFINMLRSTLKKSDFQLISVTEMRNYLQIFGPFLYSVYEHIKGVTLAPSGQLAHWIDLENPKADTIKYFNSERIIKKQNSEEKKSPNMGLVMKATN